VAGPRFVRDSERRSELVLQRRDIQSTLTALSRSASTASAHLVIMPFVGKFGGTGMAKTILVADDDPQVRKVLCEMFEREQDYDLCEQAKNGKEAVEIVMRCKPDLIVLDFSMPFMSGIQAAKQIKAKMPSVPIILFTLHDIALFTNVQAIDSLIDRIVNKSEIGSLLDHVRDLAPA
jgi:CheY-like chemotaxis protein